VTFGAEAELWSVSTTDTESSRFLRRRRNGSVQRGVSYKLRNKPKPSITEDCWRVYRPVGQ